ncbi:MAG: four helix bundle suffix domain-containing protein [Bacteroidota bacterium]|nr:four helix bundle suffix domain-containing protein [Bacteroidota bacterium]MDP4234800.1 four helix bundle suffix domain-containing protein [Bacteroidota bacterium]MDP4244166.1 four helix bundle suffix domain-containing protein [Bacteroidota bacterium]MDP4289338.1 four helix bundle suffix domain-containing protein [Bacteroidota bacterium]
MPNPPGFIEHHGYRDLYAYQKAEIIYDLTFHFCERFLRRGDRTIDQMVQAARSGKQNIIEGAKASGTSKETEIKLTNVARASLEELLADYEDYLRVRNLNKWDKNSKAALAVRRLPQSLDESYKTYKHIWETKPADAVANVALCLINQANYLLDRHIRRLDQDFIKNGGVRERMTKVRLQQRGR